MSERGDLLELVCDAYGRLPTMSATVWSWMDMERQERAMEVARQHFVGGPFPLVTRQNPDGPSEFESNDRLVIDPRRGAFRVEHEDSLNRRQFFVSDGETMWTPNFRGDVIARSAHRGVIPSHAAELLDPSWLVDYMWTSYTADRHNGREVLRLRAHVPPKIVTRLRAGFQATDVEVLIDAQLGFLHRRTEFVDGHPYQVVELRNLVLEPTLDPNVFRVDDSVRVVDEAEWAEQHKPTRRRRLWWRFRSLRWRFHRPAWRIGRSRPPRKPQ